MGVSAAALKKELSFGHVLTILITLVQAACVVAVLMWRVGALEKHVDKLDDRLWEHMRAPQQGHPVSMPRDASAVRLRRV